MSVAQLMKCYNYLIHMEPQITDFMQRTIFNLNTLGLEVSFIGDENRINSVHSFLQKCNRPDREFSSIFYIYDILRYTLILPLNSFKDYYFQIVSKIIETYDLYRVKNTWIKFDKDIPYKGINTIFASKGGILFEVQFHTLDSYIANIKTHELYERLLYDSKAGNEESLIKNEMLTYIKDLDVPRGIYDIFDYDNSKELLNLITECHPCHPSNG